jgi:hypothetical protein
VAYWRDSSTGELYYAQKSGGTWTIEAVDGTSNDVGRYAALALNGDGNPHVA